MESSKKPTKEASRKEESAAKEAAPASQQDAKRRPVQHWREDDVSVSIWSREFMVRGEARTFYSCTFERSYKDRDGAWRYTIALVHGQPQQQRSTR